MTAALKDKVVMVAKRKVGRTVRVRYVVDGVRITQEWYGGRWVTKIAGKHIYHNQAFPTDRHDAHIAHVLDSVCPTCGGGFSALMHYPDGRECGECRTQKAAELAKQFEDAGINLGWGGHARDTMVEVVRERYLMEWKSFSSRSRCRR